MAGAMAGAMAEAMAGAPPPESGAARPLDTACAAP